MLFELNDETIRLKLLDETETENRSEQNDKDLFGKWIIVNGNSVQIDSKELMENCTVIKFWLTYRHWNPKKQWLSVSLGSWVPLTF